MSRRCAAETFTNTLSSKNASDAEDVDIEVTTWAVTYVYAKSDLLLAYGIIIFCTLVCAGVGFYAFFTNDASYQNMFSTSRATAAPMP